MFQVVMTRVALLCFEYQIHGAFNYPSKITDNKNRVRHWQQKWKEYVMALKDSIKSNESVLFRSWIMKFVFLQVYLGGNIEYDLKDFGNIDLLGWQLQALISTRLQIWSKWPKAFSVIIWGFRGPNPLEKNHFEY